jgi:GNAT superfamily N-acetyltransferase
VQICTAGAADAEVLAKVINRAFVVEAFFKIGDRTSAGEVAALMSGGGVFLMTEDRHGCVYVRCGDEDAYFGMLAVDPAVQGKGYGAHLVAAAEAHARSRGCRAMIIHIVNLRADLLPYYGRLGYAETGTLPFSDPDRASRPCHFLVMTKPLHR